MNEPMSGPRLWKYEPEPEYPPPPPQMIAPTPTRDLKAAGAGHSSRSDISERMETIGEASEYAMQMICGVTCNNAGLYDQMRAIRRITYAWVNTPEKLLEAETVDDLPPIR